MYSVNQVNQLYVVGSVQTTSHVTSASADGALEGPIASNNGDFVYFKYNGAGGVIATDRIKKCKVKWITYATADTMRQKLRTWTISMNSAVNSGNPVIGQDYIINFDFKHYFGMSDEDQYFKQAAARAFVATAKTLYRDLALSLAKNMSREVDQPFKIELLANTTPTQVTAYTNKDSLTGTYTSIRLTEVLQPYKRGRYKYLRPDFTISLAPITVTTSGTSVEQREWATITVGTSSVATDVIKNGMETADLEWFCMGERGDQYRGKDWPLSISTPDSLKVDPSKEYNYLIVHFWDDIDNEGPQKSERDMTFVAEAKTTGAVNLETLANSIALSSELGHYTKVTMSGDTKTITDVTAAAPSSGSGS